LSLNTEIESCLDVAILLTTHIKTMNVNIVKLKGENMRPFFFFTIFIDKEYL